MSTSQTVEAIDVSAYANRLRKNARHWGKWARRQDISCYRVYDRDIPQFPLALDLYGPKVHLQEFDTGWQDAPEAHERWLEAVAAASAEALGLAREAVVLKRRARQRGAAQYTKLDVPGEAFPVDEGGHRFLVNLESYLDTGLFLDHRNTRRMVQQRARGRRFLNLFAYTGSFTVYAAAGGAVESLTVDLSNTYQDWARRNFRLNGLDPARHRLLRADVFAWLDEASARGDRFDLIVMDPPSFSNSKKMADVLDVQRDHVHLIRRCMGLLAPGGELFFSTNLRGFQPDLDALAPWAAEEISHLTVPEDFRNKRIHRCWLIGQPD